MATNNIINQHTVKIPQNIDIDTLLSIYPIPEVPNARCYLLYILSIIRNKEDFTPIYSRTIKKKVDQYRRLFKWLIERDVLIRNGSYWAGVPNVNRDGYPKGYKFKPEYLTELKKEFITTRTLINKIKKEKHIEADHQPLVNESKDLNSWYGYEPSWMGTREVGRLLNLNSNKIRKGLIHFGLISENYKDHLKQNNKMFYYEIREKKFVTRYRNDMIIIAYSLQISDLLVDKIKILAKDYPLIFPQVKRKPPQKSRKSRNI